MVPLFNIEKRHMKKRELLQAFEKAKTQTKCEATRVLDRLSGVRGDPFAKKKPLENKPGKGPSSVPDQNRKVKSD